MGTLSFKKPLLVFIVGPTATGKSDLALEAAKHFRRGEIINTDSVQVYDEIEVGTAKPPREAFEQVPHHLYSFVQAGETSTAGQYCRQALGVIRERTEAAKGLFFAVGGSGFYVQALEKGMYPAPDIPPDVKAKVESDLADHGLPALYSELMQLDADYGKEISPNDTYRIMRALEINRQLNSQGGHEGLMSWTEIRRKFEADALLNREFDVLKIGLLRPRSEIRESVAKRTLAMLGNEWKEEVQKFRGRGLERWAPMQSVGYKEMQAHLDGKLAWNELPAAITTSTMQLVKRQTTWFRRDKDIAWFDPKLGWAPVLDYISGAIKDRIT